MKKTFRLRINRQDLHAYLGCIICTKDTILLEFQTDEGTPQPDLKPLMEIKN